MPAPGHTVEARRDDLCVGGEAIPLEDEVAVIVWSTGLHQLPRKTTFRVGALERSVTDREVLRMPLEPFDDRMSLRVSAADDCGHTTFRAHTIVC